MKNGLSYGRISLGHDVDILRPNPVITFSPVRYQGRPHYPKINDRDTLTIMRLKGDGEVSFREAYIESVCKDNLAARELGEGKCLIRWLKKNNLKIVWKENDFKLHEYFHNQHWPALEDEVLDEHCFSIPIVTVMGRKIKLYIEDEAMLNLLNLDYGEEEDFISLVMRYVSKRFQWESWKAPAPTFLDWIKNEGKKPVFSPGQLSFRPPVVKKSHQASAA